MQPESSPTEICSHKKNHAQNSVADHKNCQKQSAKTKDTSCQYIDVDPSTFIHTINMNNNKKTIILSTSANTILTSILKVYCRRSFSSISDFQMRWFSENKRVFYVIYF